LIEAVVVLVRAIGIAEACNSGGALVGSLVEWMIHLLFNKTTSLAVIKAADDGDAMNMIAMQCSGSRGCTVLSALLAADMMGAQSE
jgi:hypothetical protein